MQVQLGQEIECDGFICRVDGIESQLDPETLQEKQEAISVRFGNGARMRFKMEDLLFYAIGKEREWKTLIQ